MTINEPSNDALRRQAKDWVVHLATGDVTQADLQALERWRAQSPGHAEAYLQASKLWALLEAPLQARVHARPVRATVRIPRLARPIGRRAFLGGAVAASAVAATAAMIALPPLHLWPSLTELAADYRTGAGEQRKIALQDQVSVELNTRTSLNIPDNKTDVQTIELVTGEAAVATGSCSVSVRAAAGTISATNAQFTVRCEGANALVTCLAGRIDVALEGRSESVLPRQQISYAARVLGAVAHIDPEVVAGWREGLLIFQDQRLAQVIDEVNRYRAGRIVLMNAALGERRISARFKLARLDAVLTQFQQVFGAKVTSLGGGFVVLT